jgi:polyketide cyclase/dehydrase/lipid transport protein
MALLLLPRLLTFRFIAVLALVLPALLGWAAKPDLEMVVEVTRSGDTFLVNALLFAPVSPKEAWAVLTDFDHMSAFVPNLSESRVTGRSNDELVVAQKGVARFGVLSFPFESVREVELHPYDLIRSRNIRGNLARLVSVTRLTGAEGGTRIDYQVEVLPAFWVPGFVGEFLIKHEVTEQLEAIVKEMLRRRDRSSRAGRAGQMSSWRTRHHLARWVEGPPAR